MEDISTAVGMFQRLSLQLIWRNEVDCGKLYNFGVVEDVACVELVVKGTSYVEVLMLHSATIMASV